MRPGNTLAIAIHFVPIVSTISMISLSVCSFCLGTFSITSVGIGDDSLISNASTIGDASAPRLREFSQQELCNTAWAYAAARGPRRNSRPDR